MANNNILTRIINDAASVTSTDFDFNSSNSSLSVSCLNKPVAFAKDRDKTRFVPIDEVSIFFQGEIFSIEIHKITAESDDAEKDIAESVGKVGKVGNELTSLVSFKEFCEAILTEAGRLDDEDILNCDTWIDSYTYRRDGKYHYMDIVRDYEVVETENWVEVRVKVN